MKLKRLAVGAFGGIHLESPIVVDFSNSNSVVLSGDMGTGKTSMLNSLLVACGHLSKDENDKQFVNNESGKIDIDFEFVGKDRRNYQVRCTKSSFKLIYEGESVPEPISMMKQLLGVVGVSPMEIKTAKVSEIIKWLAAYTSKSAEDFETTLRKHKDAIKEARATRAEANKSAKGLGEFLENEPMFHEWEKSEKKYAKEIDLADLSAQMSEARKLSERYMLAEAKLAGHQSRKAEIEQRIVELQKELETVEENISLAELYLDRQKADKTNYEKVKTRYENAANEKINYSRWQEIKRKQSEKHQFEDISQKADATEKDLLKKVADLQAEILPDIKGMELVTEDTHEDGKIKKAGLYWKGRNTAQMSETEWWNVVLQIWRKNKVKVIVIDNRQSLGSRGVELLEQLAKDGAYIFAAEMDRKKKELQISYE
jgi:DNA repair exonuclease SbcCD ATPase subunit